MDQPPLAPLRQSRLEEFCVSNSLVLIESLRAWRGDNVQERVEKLLVRNYEAINEERWLETIANEPNLPCPWPPPDHSRIPELASTPKGQALAQDHYAVILQEQPVLIIGVLNPYELDAIHGWLANNLPGRPSVFVTITPRTYALLSGLCLRTGSGTPIVWEENRDQWAAAMGVDPTVYKGIEGIVEDLWLGNPMVPVVTPGTHSAVQPIDGVDAAVCLRKTATCAWIATTRPKDHLLQEQLRQKLSRKLILMAVGPNELAGLTRRVPGQRAQVADLVLSQSLSVADWKTSQSIHQYEIVLYDKLLTAAISMGASDIHLDPKEQRVRVRFRIDGRLIEQAPIPRHLYEKLLQWIKTKGGMLQDKSGIPQDGAGHFECNHRRFDLRFALTVLKGPVDCVVIRIFNSDIKRLEDLNLPEREMATIQWFLQQNNGMLLTSGPTGSGKTTTLYGCLAASDDPELSITTIEAPVEKHFENAKQIEVQSEAGFSFEAALRSLLRQDPDIIMVGEIRDRESAAAAVQAALTGHLVFSTVHANDAVGVVVRMIESFGVDRVAFAQSLKLAMSQSLVRRLCPQCRQTRDATHEDLRGFPDVDVARPVVSVKMGCPACNATGYAGRIAILEMFPLNDSMATMIQQGAPPMTLRLENAKRGYTTLLHQACRLAFNGEIEIGEARSFLPVTPG